MADDILEEEPLRGINRRLSVLWNTRLLLEFMRSFGEASFFTIVVNVDVESVPR